MINYSLQSNFTYKNLSINQETKFIRLVKWSSVQVYLQVSAQNEKVENYIILMNNREIPKCHEYIFKIFLLELIYFL